MKFEIIAEDSSGEKMLDHLVPKILRGYGDGHEFKITVASALKNRLIKKTGRRVSPEQHKQLLHEVIGKQILAIDKTLAADEIIVIVIDSDGEAPQKLRGKIQKLIAKCRNNPTVVVALAVEEGEAWFLGDVAAIKNAFPKAKDSALGKYVTSPKENGTWEILADAIYPGGAVAMTALGYPRIGEVKHRWADAISPHMNVEINSSPSFCELRNGIRNAAKPTMTAKSE